MSVLAPEIILIESDDDDVICLEDVERIAVELRASEYSEVYEWSNATMEELEAAVECGCNHPGCEACVPWEVIDGTLHEMLDPVFRSKHRPDTRVRIANSGKTLRVDYYARKAEKFEEWQKQMAEEERQLEQIRSQSIARKMCPEASEADDEAGDSESSSDFM
jgi:hypothetical protein